MNPTRIGGGSIELSRPAHAHDPGAGQVSETVGAIVIAEKINLAACAWPKALGVIRPHGAARHLVRHYAGTTRPRSGPGLLYEVVQPEYHARPLLPRLRIMGIARSFPDKSTQADFRLHTVFSRNSDMAGGPEPVVSRRADDERTPTKNPTAMDILELQCRTWRRRQHASPGSLNLESICKPAWRSPALHIAHQYPRGCCSMSGGQALHRSTNAPRCLGLTEGTAGRPLDPSRCSHGVLSMWLLRLYGA